MKRLIASVLLIAGLLTPISTFPTCIIFYKTKNGTIYIAADSRRTISDINGNLGSNLGYAESCKVEGINGIYFGIAGHFDTFIQETIERQIRWSNDIRTIEKGVMDTGRIALGIRLTKEKSENPAKYAEHLRQGVITTAAFAYYKDHPTIDVIRWKAVETLGQLDIQPECEYNAGTSYIGINDHLNRGSREFKKKIPDSSNPERFLKAQIMLERSHHPEQIDTPIDIIRISTTGKIKQLTRMRNCDSLKALHPEIYHWYN